VMAAGSVGLAAVVTLFLFGGYLTGSLAESVGGRNDTVATTVQPHAATTQKVQASDSQQPQPQALQQQPEPIKPVKAFQEPVRETTLAEPVPPKKEPVKMRTQVEAVEPKPASQKNVAKPPLVPTTRVISTENGATKSKVVTAGKAPEKKTAPMKSAGTTRPRIVQIPK